MYVIQISLQIKLKVNVCLGTAESGNYRFKPESVATGVVYAHPMDIWAAGKYRRVFLQYDGGIFTLI